MPKPLRIRVGQTTLSAYQRKDGRYSLAYMFEGQRKYETLKDEKAARERAKQLAEAINSNKATELRLTGKQMTEYLAAASAAKQADLPLLTAVAESIEARKQLKTTGASVVAAASEYAQAMERVPGHSLGEIVEYFARNNNLGLPQKTFGVLASELVEAKKSDGLSQRYIDALRYDLTKAAEHFAEPIGAITTAQLDDWLRSLNNVSGRTRQNLRTSLITLFRFARSRGYLPQDRSTAADLTARAKVVDGEIEIYTPQEMAGLLRAADEMVVPFLVLGGFAGLRTAEICRLEWKDVQFDQEHIKIGASIAKTASRRLIPLLPCASEWLQKWRGNSGPIVSVRQQRLSEALRQVAKRTKIKWRHNALRHSFASYRLAQIKNAAQVALEMGNSPDIVFRHYRELVTERDAKTWFSIKPHQAENVVQMSKHKAAT